MEPSNQTNSSKLPIAIIIGFALIALAIFFGGKNESVKITNTSNTPNTDVVSIEQPRPIDETDYILGNPNAPILIVEYSDYECPFCKQYHSTLTQIMNEYGVTGKVAWVYRQFPLTQLHPNSGKISESALCIGKIGGNDAFWKFTNLIYNERAIDEATNMTKLPDFAELSGVSKEDYFACLDSKEMEEKVLASVEDGFKAGARATPYTILMVGDQQAVIDSAQPYSVVKPIVENLLNQLQGVVEDPTIGVEPPAVE